MINQDISDKSGDLQAFPYTSRNGSGGGGPGGPLPPGAPCGAILFAGSNGGRPSDLSLSLPSEDEDDDEDSSPPSSPPSPPAATFVFGAPRAGAESCAPVSSLNMEHGRFGGGPEAPLPPV